MDWTERRLLDLVNSKHDHLMLLHAFMCQHVNWRPGIGVFQES